jgi:hypothetical protein
VTLDLRPVSDPEARSLLEDLGLFDHGVFKPVVPRPRRRYRIRCRRWEGSKP